MSWYRLLVYKAHTKAKTKVAGWVYVRRETIGEAMKAYKNIPGIHKHTPPRTIEELDEDEVENLKKRIRERGCPMKQAEQNFYGETLYDGNT